MLMNESWPYYSPPLDSSCRCLPTERQPSPLIAAATASPAPPSTPAPALSNVALGKNTGHSSAGWGGVSSRAVDGSQSGDFTAGTCFHSNRGDAKPWWAVDMGAAQEIHQVRIINRQDCCSENLATIKVAVSDVMPSPALGQEISTTTAVCTYQDGPLTDPEYIFTCDTPVVGRYLSVQKLGGRFLALCEVEAMGRPV